MAAGVGRVEIGSIVSPRVLPQMSDIFDIWSAVRGLPGLQPSVLIPNVKGAELASNAGITNLVYVVSVSQAHNRSNLNRSVQQSLAELVTLLENGGFEHFRLNLATAFHCPYEGRIDPATVIALVDFVAARSSAKIEIALCDTTGRASPHQVSSLFSALRARYENLIDWAYHPHDTYGLGIATMFAAYAAGIRVFDASLGGIGGCPFAPGATGNVATEDAVFSFKESGIETGVDLWALAAASEQVAALDGAHPTGRIRELTKRGVLRKDRGTSPGAGDGASL